MKGLTYTCMGSNMAYFIGSEAAIPARASTSIFSARGTFSIVHSPNYFRVSRTFVRYWDMCSSLALYSFYTCPMTR